VISAAILNFRIFPEKSEFVSIKIIFSTEIHGQTSTVNREIFAALKVGEFAFFQLAVDKIPRLLQKFNG
jgi:hypothetical protein